MEQYDPDSAICMRCIGDPVLIEEMKATGTRRRCQVCDMRRIGVDLAFVIERLDSVYRAFFTTGAYWGELGHQGDYPEDIVAELLGCEHDLAEWIVDHLASDEAQQVRDGGEVMYDTGSRYEAMEAEPWYERSLWSQFEEHIKFERRFFGRDGVQLLSELLGDLGALAERFHITSTVVLEPDGDGQPLFRARNGGDPDTADQIFDAAPRSLGPPRVDRNLGGRMHPPGITAFYGSFSRDTCIRELRPSVGEHVVSAEFRVLRRLKLLNVPAFSEVAIDVSHFDPDYYRLTTRLMFLRSFHHLISQPVFPSREQLGYLPTQAVAEYLVSEMDVDGLIFTSAQGRNDLEEPSIRRENNVVLFSAPFLSSEELSHRTYGRPPGPAGGIYDLLREDQTAPQPCLEVVPDSVQIAEIMSLEVETRIRQPRLKLEDIEADF